MNSQANSATSTSSPLKHTPSKSKIFGILILAALIVIAAVIVISQLPHTRSGVLYRDSYVYLDQALYSEVGINGSTDEDPAWNWQESIGEIYPGQEVYISFRYANAHSEDITQENVTAFVNLPDGISIGDNVFIFYNHDEDHAYLPGAGQSLQNEGISLGSCKPYVNDSPTDNTVCVVFRIRNDHTNDFRPRSETVKVGVTADGHTGTGEIKIPIAGQAPKPTE